MGTGDDQGNVDVCASADLITRFGSTAVYFVAVINAFIMTLLVVQLLHVHPGLALFQRVLHTAGKPLKDIFGGWYTSIYSSSL